MLLVYRDRDGWHDIDADQINARFHELVGDDYTVKDLRTWTATVHAAVALAHADPPDIKKATTAAVKAMLTDVSDHLGNTPAIARAAYVDPRVITQYEQGRTIARAISLAGSDNLNRTVIRERLERSVARLLS